tara:strand:- start:1462 stop:1977 length:516 start_codon:yes stop_codon:yes gene_type:complete
MNAQTASVEPSINSFQVGFLGIWINNETKLTNAVALRAELGLDSALWGGTHYTRTGYLFTPVLTLEPRWFYNLNKRLEKSKRIDGNSGNFISLKTSYHPDWFVISNYDEQEVVSDISVVPTWGIRRNIGSHFNYETGIGIGYRYSFFKREGFDKNEHDVALNLHLRIGNRF